MEVLFSDEDIVVAIKPAGLLSQSDSAGGNSMVSKLSEMFGTEVFPIHRLDREVGGVMVYALTKSAAAYLSKQVADRSFQKTYICLAKGHFEEPCGIMEDLLFKDSKKNKSYVVTKERRGVKSAKLGYEILREKDGFSLAKVKLFTGRTHQIRVQFASRNHPLAGDKKYGGDKNFPQICLWSQHIAFKHPKTGKAMEFSALPTSVMNEYF